MNKCFEFAGKLIFRVAGACDPKLLKIPEAVWERFAREIEGPDPEVTLCHGLVFSKKYDQLIDHGWVEIKSAGRVRCVHWQEGEDILMCGPLPTDRVLARYSPLEAAREMIAVGHYGPLYPPQGFRLGR